MGRLEQQPDADAHQQADKAAAQTDKHKGD